MTNPEARGRDRNVDRPTSPLPAQWSDRARRPAYALADSAAGDARHVAAGCPLCTASKAQSAQRKT